MRSAQSTSWTRTAKETKEGEFARQRPDRKYDGDEPRRWTPIDIVTITKELRELPVATLGGMLKSLTIMEPEIKAMVPGPRAVGRAFTVKCYPNSIITLHKALYEAVPGRVLVVDGESDSRGALMGEVMATEAINRKVAGIVVDGAIRDIGGLRRLEYPVFARTINARVGTNPRMGFLQIPITCGGILVNPGDWIVADDEGVAAIPPGEVERVIEEAKADIIVEEEILEEMKTGRPLADIMDLEFSRAKSKEGGDN